MTPADIRLLQEAYRREYRSLLQYSRDAACYTPLDDRPIRDGIARIANEEAAEIDAFGERMDAHRVSLPHLGSFPVGYTDLNFVTVRHLLPKLVSEQNGDIGKLDADAAACTDVVARAAIQRLVDVHKRHLKELGRLG